MDGPWMTDNICNTDLLIYLIAFLVGAPSNLMNPIVTNISDVINSDDIQLIYVLYPYFTLFHGIYNSTSPD